MYLPAYFQESRTDVLHALMRARPLATLVTLAESGIVANHVPVETLPDPLPHGMLRGHIARANPLWREYRAGSEALAIFQGPQAYISPSFYPSKLETGEVVQKVNLAPEFFGEGITLVGDEIVQLTWKAHKGFVYRASDFHLLREFSYPR